MRSVVAREASCGTGCAAAIDRLARNSPIVGFRRDIGRLPLARQHGIVVVLPGGGEAPEAGAGGAGVVRALEPAAQEIERRARGGMRGIVAGVLHQQRLRLRIVMQVGLESHFPVGQRGFRRVREIAIDGFVERHEFVRPVDQQKAIGGREQRLQTPGRLRIVLRQAVQRRLHLVVVRQAAGAFHQVGEPLGVGFRFGQFELAQIGIGRGACGRRGNRPRRCARAPGRARARSVGRPVRDIRRGPGETRAFPSGGRHDAAAVAARAAGRPRPWIAAA